MTTQELTLEGVREAARRAYDEGRLTAQHPDPGQRMCFYRIGTYGCAVGVALTDETIKLVREWNLNGTNFLDLLGRGVLEVALPEDLSSIREIQVRHDAWCEASRDADPEREGDGKKVERYRLAFLWQIEHPSITGPETGTAPAGDAGAS
jgi:hypothetical protein